MCSSRNRHKSDLSSTDGRKQVLVLGAGMVCAPLVEYLYRDENISINVCSEFKEQADQLANQFPGIKSTYLNIMENPTHLTELCGIIHQKFYTQNSSNQSETIFLSGKSIINFILNLHSFLFYIESIGESDIVVSLLPFVYVFRFIS